MRIGGKMTEKMKKTDAKQLAFNIGCFYLDEGYTCEQVEAIRIEDITVDEEKITITCRRPGLLIGRAGSMIEKLKLDLVKQEYTQKLCIKEAKVNSVLFNLYSPFNTWDYDFQTKGGWNVITTKEDIQWR